MRFLTLLLLPFLIVQLAFGQHTPHQDWFHLDFSIDNYHGVSSDKAYAELLKGRQGKEIIVAVLDSGVDYVHEDLKDVMWVNKDEIAGNGIDDDRNGYVDDIHGWNFMGGSDGRNIHHDQLEATRLYKKWKPVYDQADRDKLSRKAKKEFDLYQAVKKDFEASHSRFSENMERYQGILSAIGYAQRSLGQNEFTKEDLATINPSDAKMKDHFKRLSEMMGNSPSIEALQNRMQGGYDYFNSGLKYYFNVDYDGRSIVGDDYANSYQRNYGNNDYKGPDAAHGTHVAGIIAAKRHNGVGMNGIADNVKIMSVRMVPDGDERDKDVANGIRYAVDNGAKIINMSFGKPWSWDKKAVDKAIKYAVKKGVLFVHAAMNDSKNTDANIIYPNDKYAKKGLFGKPYASSWLEVGALSWKKGEDAIATFSNYAAENVDVFAPGVAIYSTTPENNYASYQGTSMATPVVAGMAAILMGYYDLSANETKQIIMDSVVPVTHQVKKTDTEALASMKELCRTGGVVNLYKACQLAERRK